MIFHVRDMARVASLSAALWALPLAAMAQVVTQVVNLVNLFSGILIASSIVFFGGGFILYLSRLGRPYRDVGLNIMQWGVTMLFIAVVVVGLLRMYSQHHALFFFAFALIILYYLIPFVAGETRRMSGKGGGEKPAKAHGDHH